MKNISLSTDSVAQFICRRVEKAPTRLPNSELYQAYEKFCNANRLYQHSHRRFTQQLKAWGFEQLNAGARFWIGLRLIERS